MIPKGVGSANVTDDGSRIAVPALIHEASEIHASACRFSDVAGPERVSPEGRGIEAGGGRVALDDVTYGPRCEGGGLAKLARLDPYRPRRKKTRSG